MLCGKGHTVDSCNGQNKIDVGAGTQSALKSNDFCHEMAVIINAPITVNIPDAVLEGKLICGKQAYIGRATEVLLFE